MNKQSLRRKIKAERQGLTDERRQSLSREIINRLWGVVDWRNIQSLHVYLPLDGQNEVDTLPFLRAAKQQKPDLKIATAWRDKREIKTNWLSEDFAMAKSAPNGFRFGLIIVPMLAFDNRGYRLGYGGGFYDRFLSTQTSALTIGLCYEFGYQKKVLPRETHDIPLDLIVTENHIYKF